MRSVSFGRTMWKARRQAPSAIWRGSSCGRAFAIAALPVPCCKRARLGPESRAVRSSPATAPRKTSPASAFIGRWNLKKRAGSSVSSSACDRPRVCLPYQRGPPGGSASLPSGGPPFLPCTRRCGLPHAFPRRHAGRLTPAIPLTRVRCVLAGPRRPPCRGFCAMAGHPLRPAEKSVRAALYSPGDWSTSQV